MLAKTHFGWKAVDYFDLGDEFYLDVTTLKSSSGVVVTNRRVVQRSAGGSTVWASSWYLQRTLHGKVRATEKAIQDLHAAELLNVEAWMVEAKTHIKEHPNDYRDV